MATWKKVIVSGSSANLANLQVDSLSSGVVTGASGNLTTTAVNGTGNILATTGATGASISGSFSGSFTGAITTSLANVSKPNFVAYDVATGTLSYAGTGSFTATSASYALSSSYALSASYALNAPAYVPSSITGSQLANYILASQTSSMSVLSSSYAFTATSASYALSSSYALLAPAYVPSSITGSQLANYMLASQTSSMSVLSASYALTATSASYASSVNNISNAVTNNTDNYILTATGGGSINGESNLTFNGSLLTVTGNATITGDLIVAGTASFTNTDNLNVRDKFILINSGSSTLADSGWITQYNAAGSGSAFYLEAGSAGSTGTYGRFAVAYDTIGTSTSVAADEFVVTAKVNQSAPTTQTPTWGGSSTNGQGNMWLTSTGDIYIWA